MSIVVVTTSPGFGRHGRLPQLLEETGWEIIRCTDTALPDGGLSEHIGRADFLVAGLVPVNAATVNGASRLKAVLKHGVGVDNVDIPACTARGYPVTNTPGANSNAVAELAVGMMFSVARNIPYGHMNVVSGCWDRKPGTEIGGKVLGIVGLGNIGKLLARKAIALGMTVVASDLYPDQAFVAEHGIEIIELDALLSRADYVSLHVFGGTGNTALIGPRQIALMKPGACLLNLARGEVVDNDALAEALAQGRLRGAAIDAFVTEPPDVSQPLFKLSNVVFTPHSGADSLEALENVGLMVISDIKDFIAGRRSPRVLNPEVYDR
ncbi:D-3-phosphoglycerate dehydrogenase [Rhizobium sp. NFR07]|uniref:phosphoglycerate dehydrogenase n=1 Tax=Rhizobium sp. NFR07 TaxID=1566262 RepID=UPI0008ED1180|nr:phosphoglycerate dehydrogenase [Rhizobium sp. NFR07]SFB34560.1 D-3-phosphoglycerate dehydrogenase [Rhizobium sp. NFR07]